MKGNPLVPVSPKALAHPGLERAAEYAAASRSANTRKSYASAWDNWSRFCAGRGTAPLGGPPEELAVFVASLADSGRKVSTIRVHIAAIGAAHRQVGLPNPAETSGVKRTVEGIQRTLGIAPVKKAALTADLLAKLLKKIPDDLTGKRDRALLLLGFAAALRRSELVALDAADVRRHPKGLVLTLHRSKTDQRGAGRTKAIPHGRKFHIAEALDDWLYSAGIKDGPIFRGVRGSTVLANRLCTEQVARIIKARAAAIGLNPKSFAGHSLRSGYISSAADAGATLQTIATHAGHAKVDTTLGYVQVQDAFANHSGRKFL